MQRAGYFGNGLGLQLHLSRPSTIPSHVCRSRRLAHLLAIPLSLGTPPPVRIVEIPKLLGIPMASSGALLTRTSLGCTRIARSSAFPIGGGIASLEDDFRTHGLPGLDFRIYGYLPARGSMASLGSAVN